jgi:hypothetical protein
VTRARSVWAGSLFDQENRPAFRYKVTDEPAGIDQDNTDPQGSPVA